METPDSEMINFFIIARYFGAIGVDGFADHLFKDRLTVFGLFAVTAMLVCYACEQRSTWFVLGFAGACALGSVYGFLQGAWPFGLVEAIWSLFALKRWWDSRQTPR